MRQSLFVVGKRQVNISTEHLKSDFLTLYSAVPLLVLVLTNASLFTYNYNDKKSQTCRKAGTESCGSQMIAELP